MKKLVLFWRRLDLESLERLELVVQPTGVTATSTVLCSQGGGFRLDHHWRLNEAWSAQSVTVELRNQKGHQTLYLDRAGTAWRVNGTLRPDLDGASEPDLSVTPFCNTFAIRRTPDPPGQTFTLDTAFIDGPTLSVARSRQRYIRQSPRQLRYVDLGLSQGFEADLVVDDSGLVLSYEHLFERLPAPG